MSHEQERVDDIVIFGAGQMGTTIARVLLDRGIRVRFIEGRAERAREVAEELPQARVFHASAFDPEFFARERIGSATAAVFALNDDPGNLFSAILAKTHGVRLTIALAHDQSSLQVYEKGGVDVAINPRQVIAEELVRFGHDPRIRQIAMLDDDRFEILDLTVRADSELTDTRFDQLPKTGSVIGAIIRDGSAIFPRRQRRPAGGRSRDRVRGVAARVARRAGAVRLRTGHRRRRGAGPRRRRPEVAGAGVPAAGAGRDRLRRGLLGRSSSRARSPGSRAGRSTRSRATSRAPRSRRARASSSSR